MIVQKGQAGHQVLSKMAHKIDYQTYRHQHCKIQSEGQVSCHKGRRHLSHLMNTAVQTIIG